MKNCDKGESISESFSFANPELLKMLESMLEFNPYFRPTAKQLLKNKIFDSVRIKSNEESATHSIVVSADKSLPVDYTDSKETSESSE